MLGIGNVSLPLLPKNHPGRVRSKVSNLSYLDGYPEGFRFMGNRNLLSLVSSQVASRLQQKCKKPEEQKPVNYCVLQSYCWSRCLKPTEKPERNWGWMRVEASDWG